MSPTTRGNERNSTARVDEFIIHSLDATKTGVYFRENCYVSNKGILLPVNIIC